MKRHHLINLLFILMPTFTIVCIAGASTPASKASTGMTKKCPACNKLYTEETKFCGEDGTKLVGVMIKLICPECKKEGAAGEKYCKEHGKKLIPLSESPEKESESLKQKIELAKRYYKEGCVQCDAESYDLAIKSYKKAEEAYPDFASLHHNMGWLYSKLGDADNAIKHLQKYIVLSPDASDVTEVQSYIVIMKQAQEKRNNIMDSLKNRDEIMKKAIIEQKKKFSKSVIIPAGEFIMGTDEAREDEYPEHRVYLDAYEIDCYEVTNAQYWGFLDYIKRTNDHNKCFKGEPSNKDHTPKFWDNDYYNVPDYPVVRIDWHDAYAYAAWAGKRLPTEAEWEKAARGMDGRKFPWGNEWDPMRCNLSGEPNPVGSVEISKSVYGCYDMAGSVYEWCADWYLDTYYAGSPSKNPKGPENGVRRVIRGGSRFSKPFQVRTNTRKSEQPELFNLSIGFRCAKDVKQK